MLQERKREREIGVEEGYANVVCKRVLRNTQKGIFEIFSSFYLVRSCKTWVKTPSI